MYFLLNYVSLNLSSAFRYINLIERNNFLVQTCFERTWCGRESSIFEACIGSGGKKLDERCRPIRKALDLCMIRVRISTLLY